MSGLRGRVAATARNLRRVANRELRARAARRPPGDAWAFRLDAAATRVSRALKRVERTALPPASMLDTAPAPRPARVVPVTQPLALISQTARSGGTLLLRLLDDHPQCLVVPHELGSILGRSDVDPANAVEALTPREAYDWARRGVEIGKHERDHVRPFGLSFPLMRELYAEASPHGDREVLDAYFTAYFNAWTDRARPPDDDARWVVGFEPNAIGNAARMRAFDDAYPDGRVVSVVRDPWSWFASARRWSMRFANLDVAMKHWSACTEGALAFRARSPERIRVVTFDDLVLRTKATMRDIAAFLEIDVAPTLFQPTFNGMEVDDNSSFAGSAPGAVSAAPALRGAELSAGEHTLVEERAGALWQRVAA
ncbi:MAG TPA: sulfotransferase [Gaiellaceae bacterium]|nr:sulfotransferase [Gaiellaceae bacterium]